jgi:TolB protein
MSGRTIGACVLAAFAAILLLAGQPGQPTDAAFPGTNGRIVFGNFDGNDSELWTMSPDGAGRTRITDTAGEISTQPAFSPDGEKILFFRNSGGGNFGLYTMSAGGGNEQLIPNTDNAADGAWAPDGERIVFTRLTGPSDIFSMNLDGTASTNLTPNTTNSEDRHPDWSPLGDRIAYANGDIWVMDANGSNKVNLTNSPSTFEDNPDWSPDGQRIIFDAESQASGPASGFIGNRDVAVMDADGTDVVKLTNDPETDQYDPVFSPNGQQVAYTQRPASAASPGGIGTAGFGVTGIIVALADGDGAHLISPASPNDVSADWGVAEPATPAPVTPTPSPSPEPPGETRVWGDNNCSGAADPVDSLLTLRSDAGLPTNTGDCPAFGTEVDVVSASLHLWGDVDCNDAVNPVDSLKLLRFDAGLSVVQEASCPLIGSEVQLLIP